MFMCAMTHPSWLVHDVTWLMYTCAMTHPYVWHKSSICVTWLLPVCDTTHVYVCHDSSICVTCLYVPWLIHMCSCNITHSCMWLDSCICVPRLIHMCDITQLYVWHDSFTQVWVSIHHTMDSCDITHLCMCAMTHPYVWHDSIYTGLGIYAPCYGFLRLWVFGCYQCRALPSNRRARWHKRSTLIKRDQYSWKETYTYQKKPILTHSELWYGVATSNRLLKITGLFCRITSLV